MKNYLLKHRAWLYGAGIGLISSLFYMLMNKLTASATASVLTSLIVAIVCLHLVSHFLISFSVRKQMYRTAVSTGLSFELFTVILVMLFPGKSLPAITAFLFTYVAIFIATVLILSLAIVWGLLINHEAFSKLSELIRSKIDEHKQLNQ